MASALVGPSVADGGRLAAAGTAAASAGGGMIRLDIALFLIASVAVWCLYLGWLIGDRTR